MTNEDDVLIISTIADMATDDVVRRLCSLGVPHKRLNTEDFPFSQTLAFRPSSEEHWMQFSGTTIPRPRAVWYRRVRSPAKISGMDDGVYQFCTQENRAALLGGVMSLNARWMSHPAAVWQAEYKPHQLSVAARLGLAIPRTLITNDPDAIRAAFTEFKGMIVKPVRSGYLTQAGQGFSIFTSRVLEEHLAELESARLSPAIYQELVPKKFDIRVTVVGRRIFAAAIDSQSDPLATIDWRRTNNPELPHCIATLPERVNTLLLEFMSSFKLTFGAIDLIQTPDGDYVFLEVNPSGQWLWIDDKLSMGISDAIADWLAKGEDNV
jgi:glutathione synthase/RimK-type ligase-like ATP-grasp enzyme